VLAGSRRRFLPRLNIFFVARTLHRHAVSLMTMCSAPSVTRLSGSETDRSRRLAEDECKDECGRGGNKRKMMEKIRRTYGPRPVSLTEVRAVNHLYWPHLKELTPNQRINGFKVPINEARRTRGKGRLLFRSEISGDMGTRMMPPQGT
jgi:hypothetical protein